MNGVDAVGVLYGLEAINAHNGWAISVVGVTIVFTGLISLSALISQLHKLVALYDNPEKIKKLFASKSKSVAKAATPKKHLVLTEPQKQICRQYNLLAQTMDDVISLPKLLRMAELSGLKDPHANISLLIKSGILCADEQGYFRWDEDRFIRAVS
ncbi:OadG family protein [Desulfobacter latus]|uniref:OadG family protein n=1 Tax=Desulfobacter latus TaxID=2292 RepID=A0A850T737_9BACT|nr:OadG family protein [Desulfobacter latus]NWH05222.1 OadG family protein [Desulfobacter latus]